MLRSDTGPDYLGSAGLSQLLAASGDPCRCPIRGSVQELDWNYFLIKDELEFECLSA